jgi:hypothetical protein
MPTTLPIDLPMVSDAAANPRGGFFICLFIHIHAVFSNRGILLSMQTLVHVDAFFFISTIALVVLSVLLAIALYYAINILHDVREVAARVKKASNDIERDLDALRYSVKSEGAKVKGIADLVLGFVTRALTQKVAKRKKQKVEVDIVEADEEGAAE